MEVVGAVQNVMQPSKPDKRHPELVSGSRCKTVTA